MPKQLTIDDLPYLRSPHVHMKDEVTTLQKINKIVGEGANRLQVVTDFDRTITKEHENGRATLSSFCIFERSEQLPRSYKRKTKDMYQKYRSIEIDPKLPMEHKVQAMNEWMTISHQILQGIEFDSREIDVMSNKYGNSLRGRAKELFLKLKDLDVPTLVFSAGLGNIVESILRQHGILFKNVQIISNFLKFNGNVLEGFKNNPNLIHVFNKNEHAVENKYFRILQGRKNVILMGDSLGDAGMADGVDVETVLRIGFLYEHVAESLPAYKEAFDIVLIDDQTMNLPMDILNSIS